MALRFVGNQCIRSAPNMRTNGKTKLSFSMWLRINPGSGTSPNTSFLFDHGSFRGLSVYIPSDSRGYIMVESRVDDAGRTRIASLHGVDTPDGKVFHLAFVKDGDLHRWYVNGELASEAVHGGLSGTADRDPKPFSVGLNEAGEGAKLDVTIDEPTLWADYALTLEDIHAIRNRIAHPEGIAADKIAWRLTLDGAGGAPAAVGDPGLADLSGGGLDVATIVGTPTYESGVLSYTIPSRIRSARIAPSRKALVVLVEDSAGRLANVSSIGAEGPSLAIDGKPPIALGPPIWGAAGGTVQSKRPYAPFLYYMLEDPVPEGARATFSAPPGWIRSTAGEVADVSRFPVDTGAIAHLLPPLETEPAKTMKVGHNVRFGEFNQPVPVYSNLRKQSESFFYPGGDPTFDEHGNPTSLGRSPELLSMVSVAVNNDVDTRGSYPVPSEGTWTLMWDGADQARLDVSIDHGRFPGALRAFDQTREVLTGGADNLRTYHIAMNPEVRRSPDIMLRINGPDIRNLRIYPPGIDPADPGKFHPNFLRMLGSPAVIRFMDWFHTNICNVVDPEDLPDPDDSTYIRKRRQRWGGIIALAPADNSDRYYAKSVPLLVTTDAPHGLKTGQTINIRIPKGGPHGNGHFPTTLGRSIGLDERFRIIRVLSPTTFSFGEYSGQDGDTLTASYTGESLGAGAHFESYVEYAAPLSDAIELCNLKGADPWWCVPHAATDATVTAMFRQIARDLAPGRKVRGEYSNEHWNFGFAFQHGDMMESLGTLEGLSRTQWYARRSGQCRELARAAFVAEGRNPDDLIWVMGIQGGWVENVGQQIVDYCKANRIAFESMAVAPYFNLLANPYYSETEPAMTPQFDAMDVEQQMDISELFIQHGGHGEYVRRTRAILDAAGFRDVTVCCYEGGPENGLTDWTEPTTEAGRIELWRRMRRWVRHPRFRGVMLHFLQVQQDAGCTEYVDYMLFYNVVEKVKAWGTYFAYDMQAGRGDGTDGLFDNRLDFEDLARIVSVKGGAIDTWATLAGQGGGRSEVGAVTVAPATAALAGGRRRAFRATVTGVGSPPGDVTWSCSAGSISPAGLFTAPAAAAADRTVTITARSIADPNKSGTAIVTVPARRKNPAKARFTMLLNFGSRFRGA